MGILGINYLAYKADYGYVHNLIDVAIQILPGMKDGTQVWPYLHSIRKACQLDSAETLGYPAGTNIDSEDSLVVQIDYRNSLFEVSITAIGTDVTTVERHFRITDFGGPRQIASVRTSLCSHRRQIVKLTVLYSQRSSNIWALG